MHLVAAQHVYGLRRQAYVAADRDAALNEEADGIRHFLAAFELDHLGTRGHQGSGVAESLFRRFLIAAERHVGDDEGAVGAALDGCRVVGDVRHRHRQGGVMALNDIAQRIADEQAFDAGAVEQTGKAGIVGGKHDDLFASGVELGKIGLGQAAGGNLSRHLRPEHEINGA